MNMKLLPVMAAMVWMGLMASARADTVLFDNGAAGTTSATIAADSNGEVPFSPEGNVFTPTVGGTVTEINFAGEYGFNDPLDDNFTLSLYSTISGAPTTSTLLGTSTLTNFSRTDSGILLGDGFNLYDYSGTLNSPFTLDAGTPYYLGIADTTAIPGYPAPGGVGVFYLAESVSPGSANALYSLGNSEVGNHFFGPTDFPVAFELSGTAAPEPSTWALLLGGLSGLAFWRLRTRQG
jgi:hypothetical protein